ncbi:NUDIX domain-containing protein [Acidaminobacter sp. JC074]|uniref:NUDIX hydrolase n=1 Tax=Acidaminobacter sp. JC074 TaxID=2530199 RepID=UPI001F0D80DD|nr:NUDIX hydrolase [Acidaminobacter sp. JC074]MCH4891075.1 NUDIX domain-containing protein [Acidaminobacter sp. JC074]
MQLIKDIENYKSDIEQEILDKKIILDHLNRSKDIFVRDNQTAHMTASAWVVNHDCSKVLMVYHNIYDSWSWLGGHADGDTDLLNVAIKEVKEESGLKRVHPITEDIFSLETLTVDGHERRGKYVPSHLHLNVTYLLQADEEDELSIQPDENSGVQWFDLNEAIEASSEPWFKERIYSKLNNKLKKRCNC